MVVNEKFHCITDFEDATTNPVATGDVINWEPNANLLRQQFVKTKKKLCNGVTFLLVTKMEILLV